MFHSLQTAYQSKQQRSTHEHYFIVNYLLATNCFKLDRYTPLLPESIIAKLFVWRKNSGLVIREPYRVGIWLSRVELDQFQEPDCIREPLRMLLTKEPETLKGLSDEDWSILLDNAKRLNIVDLLNDFLNKYQAVFLRLYKSDVTRDKLFNLNSNREIRNLHTSIGDNTYIDIRYSENRRLNGNDYELPCPETVYEHKLVHLMRLIKDNNIRKELFIVYQHSIYLRQSIKKYEAKRGLNKQCKWGPFRWKSEAYEGAKKLLLATEQFISRLRLNTIKAGDCKELFDKVIAFLRGPGGYKADHAMKALYLQPQNNDSREQAKRLVAVLQTSTVGAPSHISRNQNRR